MVEDKESGEVNRSGEHPLSNQTELYQSYAVVDEFMEFDLPSPHITPKHMLKLAKRMEQLIADYDGMVITHGTDTLEETAYFLDLVLASEKPIILTGAMRSSNEVGSDGLYNLISSIRTASSNDAYEKGVLVVMNGEIHTAKDVTKTSANNIASFKSPGFGPIGMVTKDSVIIQNLKQENQKLQIKNISNYVFLLKAYAGMEQEMMEAVHQARPDGLVIEALGQGNLPKEIIPPLQQMIKENIPIVLVSRCSTGVVQPTYGYKGGGKQLKEMGIIFAEGLTGPKARMKLLIALENTKDLQQLKKIF